MTLINNCLYCNARVESELEFKEHLRKVHKIVENVEEYVKLSQKKREQEKRKQVIEEITLSDDEGEENFIAKENPSDVETEVRQFAAEIASALFSELKTVLNEGSFKKYEVSSDVDGLLDNDESITEYFHKIREKVNSIELPESFIDQFEDINVGLDETTSTAGAQIKSENPSGKQKRYACPLPECAFLVNKEGMLEGKAAVHLRKVHSIKPKDMRPGQFKFRKIKIGG